MRDERPDGRTDEIAREAARLLATGSVTEVGDAIRAAADAIDADGVPLPGPGRVRKHVQGMTLQALGDQAYRESIRAVWAVAEGVMTVIENAYLEAATLLCGRAARGQIDGGVTCHVRVYTDTSVGRIVESLVEQGYDEPTFETAETRFGRFDRFRFDEEGVEVVVTRCPADHWHRPTDRGLDLFRGRPVEIVTLAELRQRISADPPIPG